MRVLTRWVVSAVRGEGSFDLASPEVIPGEAPDDAARLLAVLAVPAIAGLLREGSTVLVGMDAQGRPYIVRRVDTPIAPRPSVDRARFPVWRAVVAGPATAAALVLASLPGGDMGWGVSVAALSMLLVFSPRFLPGVPGDEGEE